MAIPKRLEKLFGGNGGCGADPELGVVPNPDDEDYWAARISRELDENPESPQCRH